MITGALVQLATDDKLLALRNIARNRRVLFFLSLLAGCFVGAAATTRVSDSMALLLTAIVKALVFVSFFFNHGVSRRSIDDREDHQDVHAPITSTLWGD